MKACDFIVHYLAEQGRVDTIFTYAGGSNAMLLDSIARYGKITIVPMRHEENAALAADAYVKVKHGLGVALAMSGPGATNMITGIAQSYFDSSSVFYLTGNVTTGTYKYGRPVRQFGYQETDIVAITKPITKGSYFVDRIDMVPYVLRSSIRQALGGRPGPVHYDIPFDTQKMEVDEELLKLTYGAERRTKLEIEEYNRFWQLVQHATRPVILLGGGVQIANAVAEVKEFVQLLNMPVVASLLGRDAFDNTEPNYCGFIGSYGNRWANITLAEADLVIVLGSRVDSRQTGNLEHFKKGKTIIHIDIDSDVIGSTVQPELAIVMHLRNFIREFMAFTKEQAVQYTPQVAWMEKVIQIRELLVGDCEEDKASGGVNPKKFLRQLSKNQSAKTVYCCDVGNQQMWSAQYLQLKEGDRMLHSGGLGTMGYALPAAVGAKFADPSAELVAIVGDGGFQMSVTELSTIRTFNIPVKLVVINNGMLGLMKNFQDENFNGRYPATVEGYSVPDISKISTAYGIPAITIEKDAEVQDALEWLHKIDGPALIEVKVSNEWGPQPKVLPGASIGKQSPALSEQKEKDILEVLNG